VETEEVVKTINTLLDALENKGCSCDAMIGWRCDVHKIVRGIRILLEDLLDTGGSPV